MWRISDFADISGEGGLRVPGRWHPRGHWIVYLSDHPASALLEVIVHLEVNPGDLPSSFQLLTVEIADDIAFDMVGTGDLGPNWRATPSETQEYGVRWLSAGKTALLQVPSAIVPYTWNWLLNPRHPDIRKVRVVDVTHAAFDPRLLT